MSALIGDLPRKPLTPEERMANRENWIKAQHAMAHYSTEKAVLRRKLEELHHVKFEQDGDGFWYVSEDQVLGEYDVENFTPEQMRTYELYRSMAVQLLERTRVVWPKMEPKEVHMTVTRWRKRP